MPRLTLSACLMSAALAQSCPQDQATGFEPGQLRRAIRVRWPPAGPADH